MPGYGPLAKSVVVGRSRLPELKRTLFVRSADDRPKADVRPTSAIDFVVAFLRADETRGTLDAGNFIDQL